MRIIERKGGGNLDAGKGENDYVDASTNLMTPMLKGLFGLSVFLPLAVRIFMCVWYPNQAGSELTEDEKERNAHRSLIMPLAGFSFTALLGLSLAKMQGVNSLSLPIYFLFVSFISYLVALNIQGYKEKRWHDLLGTGLMDVGSLGLILAVVTVLIASLGGFAIILGTVGILAWASDWFVRNRIMCIFLREQRNNL